MTYRRVLPRDLFNEAKLLKCLGRLILLIEDNHRDFLNYHHDGDEFYIQQDPSSGSISVTNIQFYTPLGFLPLCTSLNSREEWPLRLETNDESIDVFNDKGFISAEFHAFVTRKE